MLTCRLQAILDARGMSRRALARQTGLDRSVTLKRLCDDTWQMVDRATLERLCQALEVTPQELFTYDPDA